MVRVTEILRKAEEVAATAPNWADLSNALFDPIDGLVATAYPTADDRANFAKSDAYRQIRELIAAARTQSGLVEGAQPTKSGKFVLRLPKSLHAALDREAALEGVSLNQLIVAKLAVQLNELAGHRRRPHKRPSGPD